MISFQVWFSKTPVDELILSGEETTTTADDVVLHATQDGARVCQTLFWLGEGTLLYDIQIP